MLPLEPQPAAMLLAAIDEKCEAEALGIAAMLSLAPPFVPLKPADLAVARAPFAVYEGDALTSLNVLRAYERQRRRGGGGGAASWCRKHLLHERVLSRALEVRAQLSRHLRAFGASGAKEGGAKPKARHSSAADHPSLGGTTGTDAVRRAIVRGFFANAARHDGAGAYTSVLRGASLRLHPSCSLFKAPAPWIVYHETVLSAAGEAVLAATKVEEAWLPELAPHFYAREEPRGAKRPRAG